jgi:feruloyl esterase
LTWNTATTGQAPTGFAADFFRYLAFQDPSWDYTKRPINYDSDVALANRPEIAAINAVEPDLRPFFRRGGKILMYVGWNDGAIPPLDSTRYYNSIVAKSGSQARDGVRLFMVPDMGHCPANAAAANGYLFDPMPVVAEWKTAGKTPDSIVISHRTNGAEDRTMLVCPYPQAARYKGTGSTADAANFVCRAR